MAQYSLIPTGRECSTCDTFKPFTEFRKKAAGWHGHSSQCKACLAGQAVGYRDRTRERRLDYNRRYYSSDKGRAVIAGWHDRNPAKRRAQYLMNRAVERGELVKPDECECCSAVERLDGHHPDYAKPLDVMWLCRSCHKDWHRKHGEAANADIPVPPPSKNFTEIRERKAARLSLLPVMLAGGMTQKAIAAALHVSQWTIHNDLKRQGLTRRYSTRG